MSRSLAEEIEVLVKDVANNNQAPKKCIISKIYDDNHVDIDIQVGDEIGTIQYRPCIGNAEIGDEAVIIFINGNINEGYVICNTSIPSLENYYNKEESRALLKAYFSGKVVDVQVINGKLRVTKWEDGDFHVDEDIPLDTDVLKTLQKKLTAGSNITIDENNVISAIGGGGSSVQSDWSVSDSSSLAFIKNKPDLTIYQDKDSLDSSVGLLGYIKSAVLDNYYTKTVLEGLLALKADVSDLPTKLSDLVNDVGYVTSSYHDNSKVDKVTGKGLSTNDYTTSEKSKLASLENYDDSELRDLIDSKASSVHNHSINDVSNLQVSLNGKVDKVNGKGLSTVDFTDTHYVHTDNNYTTSEKSKLASLENYDDTDVKSDIQDLQNSKADKLNTYTKTETDAAITNHHDNSKQDKSSLDRDVELLGYLKEHQSLSNYYTKTETDTKLTNKADTIHTQQDSTIKVTTQNYGDINQEEFNSMLSYDMIQIKNNKQDKLVSGTNIKTINNQSLIGSGDITIGGGGQVQSDWEQSDNTQVDYIKNKPNLSIYQEKSTIQSIINTEVHNVLKEIFTGKTATVAVVNGKLQVTTFEEEDL